jgi:hypothetical protein
VETEQMLAAKFEVLFPYLDERQRRLLVGAEARALGHSGIRAVARAAGVAENTVSRVCPIWTLASSRWAGHAGPAGVAGVLPI